jgi:hypothetical protein
MNKFLKGGLFLVSLFLLVFAIITLISGGMGALGIALFAALGIGSALIFGSTGWDGVQYLIATFKSDKKEEVTAPAEKPQGEAKLDEKKPIVVNKK